MKYIIWGAGVILALALFAPASGTTKIRNLPLLIALVLCLLVFAFYRILKHAFLMHKAKNALKQKGFHREKVTFFPFASMLHGHYSMTFRHSDKKVKIVFLVAKRKYPHYYFNSVMQGNHFPAGARGRAPHLVNSSSITACRDR